MLFESIILAIFVLKKSKNVFYTKVRVPFKYQNLAVIKLLYLSLFLTFTNMKNINNLSTSFKYFAQLELYIP